MSRAARRRDQVDASQSGVRLHFDRRFISQPSALAVRADCENQLGSVRLRALHPLSAVGDPRVEVSFQSSSCCFGPGFCLPKPWSVVLYRALAIAETPFEWRVVVNHIQTSQRCFLQCQFSTDLNVAFRLLIHALNSVHRNPVPLFCTAGRRFANNQILTRILVSHGSGPAESHFHIGRNSQFCVLFQSRVKTCNLGRI